MKTHKITVLTAFTLLFAIFGACPMQKREIKKEWQAGSYKIIEITAPRLNECESCGHSLERQSCREYQDRYIIFNDSLCPLCSDSSPENSQKNPKMAYDCLNKEIGKLTTCDCDVVSNKRKHTLKFNPKVDNIFVDVRLTTINQALNTKTTQKCTIKNEGVCPIQGEYSVGSNRRDDNDFIVVQTLKEEDEYIALCDPIAFYYPQLKDSRYIAFLKKSRKDYRGKTTENVFVKNDGTIVCVCDRKNKLLTIFQLLDKNPGLCLRPENSTKFAKSHDLFWKCK